MCSCGGSRPSAPSGGGSGPPSGTATCPSAPVTREVDQEVTETISNASAGNEAWNGTYSWDSKFSETVNPTNCTVTVTVKIKVVGTVTDAQKNGWKQAIEGKWNNKVRFCCTGSCPDGYSVRIVVQYVDSGQHYTVRANQPSATEGGRAGLGGTTSMTGWGVNDTVDVTHEFGHMLGNPEEYFTTNGVDYTYGGTRTGIRDPGGGIMNNPANDPLPSNYNSIRSQAESALGGASCVAQERSRPCRQVGDFPVPPENERVV